MCFLVEEELMCVYWQRSCCLFTGRGGSGVYWYRRRCCVFTGRGGAVSLLVEEVLCVYW